MRLLWKYWGDKMQYTENYSFKKPELNESVKISDINYNFDQIDSALTPIADPEEIPAGCYNYKLVDGMVVERTDTEKQSDLILT